MLSNRKGNPDKMVTIDGQRMSQGDFMQSQGQAPDAVPYWERGAQPQGMGIVEQLQHSDMLKEAEGKFYQEFLGAVGKLTGYAPHMLEGTQGWDKIPPEVLTQAFQMMLTAYPGFRATFNEKGEVGLALKQTTGPNQGQFVPLEGSVFAQMLNKTFQPLRMQNPDAFKQLAAVINKQPKQSIERKALEEKYGSKVAEGTSPAVVSDRVRYYEEQAKIKELKDAINAPSPGLSDLMTKIAGLAGSGVDPAQAAHGFNQEILLSNMFGGDPQVPVLDYNPKMDTKMVTAKGKLAEGKGAYLTGLGKLEEAKQAKAANQQMEQFLRGDPNSKFGKALADHLMEFLKSRKKK